jgi:ABC-2 type transport system permease protein
MRLFVSALRKLAPRMATLLTFGLLAGMLVLIDVAVVATRGVGAAGPGRPENVLALITFPGAYDQILSFILGLGGLFAVIYGAAIAGSEWTWGTLKTAVARGESRSRYLLATFAAIAVVLAIGILFTAVVGVIAAAVGATVAGIGLSGIGDRAALEALPEHFLRGWVAITETAALGFAVATLARSQLAGIGVGIALYFGETFAGLFLPDVVKYLPFHLATAAVGGSTGFAPVPSAGGLVMSIDTALVLVAVWLLGSVAVAAGFGERAEITG